MEGKGVQINAQYVQFQVGRRRNMGKGNGEGVTTRAERKPGEGHHRTECVLKEEGL